MNRNIFVCISLVEEDPLTVRCIWKLLFIPRSLNELREKGLAEEPQKRKAQSSFISLLILTILPDVLKNIFKS